jgi:hypothetical protein
VGKRLAIDFPSTGITFLCPKGDELMILQNLKVFKALNSNENPGNSAWA